MVRKDPATETDRATTHVVDRKQDSVDEIVAESRSILPLTYQSGCLQLADAVSTLGPHLQPIPDGRMEADAELRDHLRAQASLIRNVLAGTSRRGVFQQEAMELLLGPTQYLVQPRLLVPIRTRTASSSRHLEIGSNGQLLERLAELDVLEVHHPRKTVASGIAHPASIRLPISVDVHRRVVVFVEGTQAHMIATPTARRQRDRFTDQRDKIRV